MGDMTRAKAPASLWTGSTFHGFSAYVVYFTSERTWVPNPFVPEICLSARRNALSRFTTQVTGPTMVEGGIAQREVRRRVNGALPKMPSWKLYVSSFLIFSMSHPMSGTRKRTRLPPDVEAPEGDILAKFIVSTSDGIREHVSFPTESPDGSKGYPAIAISIVVSTLLRPRL